MSEVKLNITTDNKELVILQGDAPTQPSICPNKIEIEGAITAPLNYFEDREELIPQNGSHVLFSISEGWIMLVDNARGPYPNKVKGSLTKNPLLGDLGINNYEKKYTSTELLKKLKAIRYYFPDKEAHTLMIKKLRNIKATFTAIVEKADDQKGHTKDFIERQMETNIDFSYYMKVPVYIGEEPELIHVDIVAGYEGGDLVLSLESFQLLEIMEERSSEIIHREISDINLLKIQVS